MPFVHHLCIVSIVRLLVRLSQGLEVDLVADWMAIRDESAFSSQEISPLSREVDS